MTPHITAKKGEIARTVFLTGCPLRAKLFAEKCLENIKQVSYVRGIGFYTGTYKGKEVTFGASGMGYGSMGIYSFELFNFYDVEKIVRLGSAGALTKDLKLFDLVLVSESLSDDYSFARNNGMEDVNLMTPSDSLNSELEISAKEKGIDLIKGRAFSTNVFYDSHPINEIIDKTKAICVEMESFALFTVARRLNKKASCLLTISDNLISKSCMTAEEREKSLFNMLEVALGII